MGWRSTVRSVNAAQRRTRLVADRIDRTVAQQEQRAARGTAALDAELEREIEKVARWEATVRVAPVRTLRMGYSDGGWSSEGLSDNSGAVTFSLAWNLGSADLLAFNPESLDVAGVTLRPLGLTASRYFVAIAFEAAAGKETPLKLVNKTRPESGKIALALPSGELRYSFDTSLDGRLFSGTKRVGVIAFEPLKEPVDSFEIVVSGGSNGGRIGVTSPELSTYIEGELGSPTISEVFTKKARETQASTKAEIESSMQSLHAAAASARAKSSGCMVLIALLGSLAAGLTLALAFRS